MSFQLVPKSVTLNNPERRNSPNGCVISPNLVAFGADYVKVVDSCSINVGQRIQFLAIYHLWRYWQGNTPSEIVKVRHSPLSSENLTISWKRCKIGGKFVLITNRKQYMSFRLVLMGCRQAVWEISVWVSKKGREQNIKAFQHTSGKMN